MRKFEFYPMFSAMVMELIAFIIISVNAYLYGNVTFKAKMISILTDIGIVLLFILLGIPGAIIDLFISAIVYLTNKKIDL